MGSAQHEVSVSTLGPEVVMRVKVRVKRSLYLRLRLARWLIRLAARVLGCSLRIEEAEDCGP